LIGQVALQGDDAEEQIALCVDCGHERFPSIDEMMRVLEALPDRFEVCYEAS
jgi:hypothetical protein